MSMEILSNTGVYKEYSEISHSSSSKHILPKQSLMAWWVSIQTFSFFLKI